MFGASKTLSLEEATAKVREMAQAAKKVNPDVFVLTHGGPFRDVATAQYSIVNSLRTGMASGSSGERVPTEQAVVAITKEYKAMPLS
jgi:predicted TIM-barrel enzyme